jgi:hypothetical protein
MFSSFNKKDPNVMKQMHGFAVHKTKTIEKRCSSNQENKLVCLEIKKNVTF